MDPDANLEEQLELARSILEDGEELAGDDELVNSAERLAELVQALDGWINSRGFLPKRWRMDDHSE
jgi:hypothetical protein